LFGTERIPADMGRQGYWQAGGVHDCAVWRFEDGKVAEISTIQDRFALLKQIGYLQDEVCPA
jgi:hypothetical protein